MPTVKRKPNFFDTEEGIELEDALRNMMLDAAFNTESTYSADCVKYPDGMVTFVDKHKCYLIAHPTIDPISYVKNLRLKTRLR